jgi:hypothetical protein
VVEAVLDEKPKEVVEETPELVLEVAEEQGKLLHASF